MLKVFINPGHGGNDSGAVGFGLKEKDIVLQIGKKTNNILQSAGVSTKLLQVDGLQVICDAANEWLADLFVSIHANAFNGTANGTETYSYYNSAEGKKLAFSIHTNIIKSLPVLTNRGIKEAGYYVLKHTDMTAVLVETAFIDNQKDNNVLQQRTDYFAMAIAKGILDYAGFKFPAPDVVDVPINVQTICPYCGK